MVSASAVGFYGDRGDEELTEESVSGTGFLAQVCREWEVATGPAVQRGVRVVRLRSGVVLSARGGALARQLPLFRLGVGGRLGDGTQWLSWITLADEVGAIVHILGNDSLDGPVNATAPAPVTNRTFTGALGRALHRPTVLPVPGFALRVALGPDLASEMVLAGQRVVPARLRASGYQFLHGDIDTALADVAHAGRRRPPTHPATKRPGDPCLRGARRDGRGARFSTTVARSSPPGSTARTGMVTPLST